MRQQDATSVADIALNNYYNNGSDVKVSGWKVDE